MAALHTSLDLYGFQVHLATTKADYRELRQQYRWLAKHNPDESGSCSFYVDIPKVGLPTPHLVLWIDTNRITTEADLIETVAHEAAHGANHVCEFIDHKVTGLDEPHAYLAGWLTRWTFEACKAEEATPRRR